MFLPLRLLFVTIAFAFLANVTSAGPPEADFIGGPGQGGGVCSLIVFYIWKETNIVVIITFVNCLRVLSPIGT